jgi:DinB superfamily
MTELISLLNRRLAEVADYWNNLNEAERQSFPSAFGWSKKQVLGHLIDSAQNNIRRFVVGQYRSHEKIVYDQNVWVRSADYQHYPSADLLELWRLLNQHLTFVWQHLPSENYETLTDWGKEEVVLVSLKEVAEDYLRHLDHHLRQLGMSVENAPYQAPVVFG